MPHYLLSVHSPGQDHQPDDADAPDAPAPTPEQAQAWFEQVQALEADLQGSGAWVFSGRLSDPGSATVVRAGESGTMTIDGPFVESKEHLAGFYLIRAEDLDAALDWATRVTECIGAPIEVRPFTHTGDVQPFAPEPAG